ncbi:MAG: DNA-directed RNA polymerase subunit alpha C-terminal domain-containing protein [Candidatus Omnitrophica bacterium]|nr:DNA-directed RNA polymerase subunit alpha C-terminal domain-containing protein [Candidatus Omnitrophota bacterium]
MPRKSLLANSDVAIDESGLSVRAANALRTSGYHSLSACINLSVEDLLKIRDIGQKTAKEIFDVVNSFKRRYHRAQFNNSDSENSLSHEEKYLYWITVLSVPITKIELSVRATHVLRKTRAHNLLELVKKKSNKILRIRDCGKKTLREITDFLRQLELHLDERLEANIVQDVMSNISQKTADEIVNDLKNKYPQKYNILIKAKVNNNLDASKIKFYTSCFNVYQERGTLQLVAEKMHLTRERIRQILAKGTQLGLFNYTGRDYHYIDKNKILDDYSKYLSFSRVAQANGIPSHYLKTMLTAYKITEKDLDALRLNSRKNKCIEFYRKIEAELGHSPTTTELQNGRGWRYLLRKISQMWGSIDAFREELRIPKPIRTFPEASRKWQENRKRVAFIVRMQNLDQIRDCLVKTSPMSSNDIASECNIKYPKGLRLLNLLLARGEIVREGTGSSTKYNLSKKQETA